VIVPMVVAPLVAAVVAAIAIVLDLPVVTRRRALTLAVAALLGVVLSWSTSALTASLVVAAGWGVVAGGLAVQTVVDLGTRTLPRQISYATLALAVPLLMWAPAPVTDRLLGMLIGAVAMTAITGVLVLLARGGLGIGDFHLSPLLGAAVGWVDPWAVATAWFVTALIGGIVALVLLAFRRVGRGGLVPYGPFMIAGTVCAVVVASFGAAI
jgi:leader peptidase (prepilin peptidase) / N-methyltransferase